MMAIRLPIGWRTWRQVDPLSIWRWGFAVLLAVVGGWLVYAQPRIGAASGRTVGWIMIGYAAVRTVVMQLNRRIGARRKGKCLQSHRESA
jgi:hypothetical protein